MHLLPRITILALILSSALVAARAQTQPNQTSPPHGSITGRVTINGQPAPGVVVALQSASSQFRLQRESLAEATTDENGRYQLVGIAEGRYFVTPLAPGFALPITSPWEIPGKAVNIVGSSTVKDMDFTLARGGVISGRVMDADGQPMISERVELTRIDERGQKMPYRSQVMSYWMLQTDDRGMYRLYGLPSGRYLISAGRASESGGFAGLGSSRAYYPRTFHPDATSEAQARVIEVTAGGEVTGVDIRLGRAAQTHVVFGRVVHSETGQPIPGATLLYAALKNSATGGPFTNGSPTDAQGNFSHQGILPGRYQAALNAQASGYYSEPVTVEITDQDVTGVEIKARPTATVSGKVVIEGETDPAAMTALFSRLVITYHQPALKVAQPTPRLLIGSDGSFRVTGLLPGKAQFYLSHTQQPEPLPFRLAHPKAVSGNTIEVSAPGEQITSLRLVFTRPTSDRKEKRP
jgi:protocatechuate 3,4-dioxygenase beta subunit